jgi:hypothetical protein
MPPNLQTRKESLGRLNLELFIMEHLLNEAFLIRKFISPFVDSDALI